MQEKQLYGMYDDFDKTNNRFYIRSNAHYIRPRNINFIDINPRDAGFQQCPPDFCEPPHKRWYYILHYIVSGEGYLRIEDREYNLSKGQTFLIRPNTEVTYKASAKNPWSYIWIGFDGTFAQKLETLEGDIFKLNATLFEKIKDAAKYETMREAFLAGCIFDILTELMENSQEINTVSIVKGYIDSDTLFNSPITDLAKLVNLSTDYLTRIFKQETGMTLSEYVTNKKMSFAKKLLTSNYTVSEVAQMTGYSDTSTLSRAYKKHFGYPPSKELK